MVGVFMEFKELLKDNLHTANEVQKKNEFVEVILTVSQKPKTQSSYTYGTVNPKMVLTAIAQTLNDPDVIDYLYGGIDGEAITPNTTVNDVRGKLVVKVNVNTSGTNIISYGIKAPMLVSEGSMATSALEDGEYIKGDIIEGVFDIMNDPDMYWSNHYPSVNKNVAPMKYYYHQLK